MKITRVKLDNFTAFDKLDLALSPGINVLVGANGTGKTHLMKVAYAACDITKSKLDYAEKLIRVFLPSGRALGRLAKRLKVSSRCMVEIYRDDLRLRTSFSNHSTVPESATVTGAKDWSARRIESVYIPVKEMLSNAPGFRASIPSERFISTRPTPISWTAPISRDFAGRWTAAASVCSPFCRRPLMAK
ncbi:AAA family ATPase [Candidatus Amarolinea dominans]|uniref:AAA family ATPase n=1 Tax=Candidatus Amarolinea dominans TaxID=3140696 RepID=UPI0031CC9470